MAIFSEQEKSEFRYIYKIPQTLRAKYVSSRVSREIFLLDALNDLINISINKHPYHIQRASILLRMLMTDKDDYIKSFYEPYDIDFNSLIFICTAKELTGSPFSNTDMRERLKAKFSGERHGTGSYKYLDLLSDKNSSMSFDSFKDKICVQINSSHDDYNFSVKNIIHLLANKHGGGHLEFTYDSNSEEAFFFGEFNPFSITSKSIYLQVLTQIIEIITKSIEPLGVEIQKNLLLYDKKFVQVEAHLNTKRETK